MRLCKSLLMLLVLGSTITISASWDRYNSGSNWRDRVQEKPQVEEKSIHEQIKHLAQTTPRWEFEYRSLILYKKHFMNENITPLYESESLKRFFRKYGYGANMRSFRYSVNYGLNTRKLMYDRDLRAKINAYYYSVQADRYNMPSYMGYVPSSQSTDLLNDLVNSYDSGFKDLLKRWFNESYIGRMLKAYFDLIKGDPDDTPDDEEPQNEAPVAIAQSITLDQDSSKQILLTGEDADGDSLTYTVNSPSNGTLSGTAPNLTYIPNNAYSGNDSFTFKVNDSKDDSDLATVSILVVGTTPVNNAPKASAQSVSVEENVQINITLNASDDDGDELTYTVSQPSNGVLSGEAPNLTYTPDTDFVGWDSFEFKVNDGTDDSGLAKVTIEVTQASPVNTTPVVSSQNVSLDQDTQKDITLVASDSDGDDLTYSVSQPSQGTLSGTAPNLTYTPTSGFVGNDSFTFSVNDGTVDSDPATVSIEVKEVVPDNNAPVASSQEKTMVKNTQLSITLVAADADEDGLTYNVGEPRNGTLSGEAPDLKYIPANGFDGSDSFTFTVNDGSEDSNTATVTITVTNDAPVAQAVSVSLEQDTQKSITLSATDKNGDEITYDVGSPKNGSLSGTAPNLTYTPDDGFYGSDSFTYKVNDGSVDSASVKVSIEVTEVDNGPNPETYLLENLNGQVLYVKSDVADMTVTMYDDGSSGKGKMGFLSMSFTYNENLISTSSMGDYSIEFTYIDEGHCIAADVIDTDDGEVYKSYWFSNSRDESDASSMSEAKSICLKNQ